MKILMADYYGTCDDRGAVLGHSVKVLREYAAMLRDHLDVSLAGSPCIVHAVENTEDRGLFRSIDTLQYDILETKGYGIGKRIADKFKLFHNIREVYRLATGYDTVWFYRTDFFLFLYVYLHRKLRNTRMVCMVYQQSFTSGRLEPVLQHVYNRALQKFNLVICTNPNTHIDHPHVFYMPDYTFDSREYAPYLHVTKKNMAVCVGAMNPYKQLEETVEAFNANGMQLRIAGKFFDAERAERLLAAAHDNVVVENRILTNEEYYQALSEAKYAMIPYDMNQYRNRTSGVLQECIFLGTIPIAPAEFLEQNDVPGIGYASFADLKDPAFLDVTGIEERLETYRSQYDRSSIAAKLRQELSE